MNGEHYFAVLLGAVGTSCTCGKQCNCLQPCEMQLVGVMVSLRWMCLCATDTQWLSLWALNVLEGSLLSALVVGDDLESQSEVSCSTSAHAHTWMCASMYWH
jgi:hypothetical protein